MTLFFGSSPNSGEGGTDLEEEVAVVAEAIGHALDHLDPVVDAFDEIGAQGPAGVGQDARQVRLEPRGELAQRFDQSASRLMFSRLRSSSQREDLTTLRAARSPRSRFGSSTRTRSMTSRPYWATTWNRS